MRILGTGAALALLLCLAPAGVGAAPAVKAIEKKDLKSYEIPYKFTAANHIVVRAKINGKGPFNFVLDTGAPALFVATEVGKQLGVEADESGWATFKTFEIE